MNKYINKYTRALCKRIGNMMDSDLYFCISKKKEKENHHFLYFVSFYFKKPNIFYVCAF